MLLDLPSVFVAYELVQNRWAPLFVTASREAAERRRGRTLEALPNTVIQIREVVPR